MLEPNKFGKYKKEEVLANGYQIVEYGYTATDIKKETGIAIPPAKRLEHCIGFVCKQTWYGCVPVFDMFEIAIKKDKGEL